jgi:hypothetical protein
LLGLGLPVGAEFRLSGDELDEMGKRLAKRDDSEERPWRLLDSFSFLEEEEGLGIDLDFLVGVALLGEGDAGAGEREEERWGA